MTKNDLLILAQCPLFCGIETEAVSEALKKAEAYTENFSLGEEIPLRKNKKNRIGILLSGEAKVFSAGEGRALLNRLGDGSLFGVARLFGSEGAGTRIIAIKKSRILFLEEEKSEVLWAESRFRQNLISFLTDRICFLNRKIAFLSEGGAHGKLLRFLSDKADENGCVLLPCSFSELAKLLNIGRASLYRAIEKLEADGIIKKEKKKICLLAPDENRLF